MRRATILLAFAALVAGCGSYSFHPAKGANEKAKPSDCHFKVTETPPPEGYWRELGTFDGGSSDTVADLVKAVRSEACRAGAEMLVPEEHDGKYIRAVAYASRKNDLRMKQFSKGNTR
jgi:hypothetical protein